MRNERQFRIERQFSSKFEPAKVDGKFSTRASLSYVLRNSMDHSPIRQTFELGKLIANH